MLCFVSNEGDYLVICVDLQRCAVWVRPTGEEFEEHFVRAALGGSWAQIELPDQY